MSAYLDGLRQKRNCDFCRESFGSTGDHLITPNGGSAGRAGWRAVLPNEKHEFSASCWAAEMITIRFAGWISGRILNLQPDIQKLLSNKNRIRIRISETLLSIFRGFRLLEIVAHCTIIHLLSSEASCQPSAPWLRDCLWCNLWTVEWVMPSLSAWICSWCGKVGLSFSVH